MNEKINKISLGVNVIIFFILSIFCLFFYFESKKQNNYLAELQIKQKQLDDSIIRSSSSNVSKEDLKDLFKQNKIDLSVIEKDLKNLNGRIESLNTVQIYSTYQNKSNVQTETKIEKPNEIVEVKPDELKKETQYITIGEQFINQKIPFAKIGFSHWRKNPWEYEVYERKYKISNVISKDKDNNTIVYNKVILNVNDKDYELKIDKADSFQITPENQFYFYPKLFLSLGSGYAFNHGFDSSVYIYAGLIQYGQFRNSPKMSILNIGAGTNFNDYKVSLVPVFFNLQNVSKFLQNSYIGLGAGFSTNKNLDVSLNFAMSF